jgi:hypothetical protein
MGEEGGVRAPQHCAFYLYFELNVVLARLGSGRVSRWATRRGEEGGGTAPPSLSWPARESRQSSKILHFYAPSLVQVNNFRSFRQPIF